MAALRIIAVVTTFFVMLTSAYAFQSEEVGPFHESSIRELRSVLHQGRSVGSCTIDRIEEREIAMTSPQKLDQTISITIRDSKSNQTGGVFLLQTDLSKATIKYGKYSGMTALIGIRHVSDAKDPFNLPSFVAIIDAHGNVQKLEFNSYGYQGTPTAIECL